MTTNPNRVTVYMPPSRQGAAQRLANLLSEAALRNGVRLLDAKGDVRHSTLYDYLINQELKRQEKGGKE